MGPLGSTIFPCSESSAWHSHSASSFDTGRTYCDPPLENQRFIPGTFAVRKCTHCLSGFVLISDKEVVESLMAKSLEKPLSVGICGGNALVGWLQCLKLGKDFDDNEGAKGRNKEPSLG